MVLATIAIWLILVYALLVILGGIIGYARARSMPSLVAGVVSGILLLVSFGYSLSNQSFGLLTAALLALLLFVVFLRRYRATGKLMPAGMMMGVSVLMLVVFLSGMVAAMASNP